MDQPEGKEGTSTMKTFITVIAAVYADENRAKATIEVLGQMHRARSIALLGAAMATEDEQGEVHIEEITDVIPHEAAQRLAVAGAVFALINPPRGVASAVVTAARPSGASDTRVRRGRLEGITSEICAGKTAVIVLAEDKWLTSIQLALVGYEGALIIERLNQAALQLVTGAESPRAATTGVPQIGPASIGDQETAEDRLERVRDGMAVVDAAGETVGTVTDVKFGDPEPATVGPAEGGNPLGDAFALALGAHREPDVPAVLAERLLRGGYIKIDDEQPLRPHHHYYASAGEIAAVIGRSVRLTRRRHELITPEN
jgi:uncharacterized membrane protein